MKLHHVGIGVPSISMAIDYYRAVLQMEPTGSIVFDRLQDAKLVMLQGPGGGPGIELIEPGSADSPVAGQARRGGIAHTCFEVENVDTEINRLREAGALVVREPMPAALFGGRRVAFLYLKGGHLVELVEAEFNFGMIEAHLDAGRFLEARAALAPLLKTDRSARTVGFINRWLDGLHARGLGRGKTTVYVLRSITLEPLAPRLRATAFLDGLDLNVAFGEFNQFEQEIAGLGALPLVQPDFVIVAARLNELAPPLLRRYLGTPAKERAALTAEILARVKGWLDRLRQRWAGTTVLLCGFEQPLTPELGLGEARMRDSRRHLIAQLNFDLSELCQARPGVYFVDIDTVIAEIGRARAYDQRLWAHASLPYSVEGLDALARTLARFVAAVKTPRRKCIVLDCDNTLWGGVLGEDGIDGIALGPTFPGSAFIAFQDALLNLHDQGIILALCTKNNEADVLEVLDTHPSQVLRREHFAAMRIGWDNKATGLVDLAKELNIGLESIIMIDDSSFECELVRSKLPEVEIVQTAADPLGLVEMLDETSALDILELSSEDLDRGKIYRDQAARTRARENFDSIDDYLEALDMRLELAWTGRPEIGRVAQLTQKTNQFNLTTRRYREQDIEEFVMRDDVHTVHARLTDRFGEHGVTVVAILIREKDALRIDTLLMSCRIIGRGVEDALIAWVLAFAESLGVRDVVGEYVPSAKNQQTKDLYRRHGFERCPGSNNRWRWRVGRRPLPQYPKYIAVTIPKAEVRR
jgi:FkbH-like protein